MLTVSSLGEQGGSQPDGGYAEVGPKEEAKCRKSSSLSLLPGAFLLSFICWQILRPFSGNSEAISLPYFGAVASAIACTKKITSRGECSQFVLNKEKPTGMYFYAFLSPNIQK